MDLAVRSAIDGAPSAIPSLSVLNASGIQALPRWSPGERLNNLIENSCALHGGRAAIETEDQQLTYTDLDRRANQLAHYLIAKGVLAGDRIGLLFGKTAETYVALLAVLKAGATYVPLDRAFPTDRLNYIADDAQLSAILSLSAFAQKIDAVDVKSVLLDECASEIAGQPVSRPKVIVKPDDAADICYIIYTSGTTGNPKGVVIEHASICNFVRVAASEYGYQPGDRVYQGMTIAFDFSVEEIWVPLLAGATLVPGGQERNLIGEELGDFLYDRKVTCLCCCPTLLSTIDRELPDLRIMLLGGEACPQNLVERWHGPDRTILNSYGPTEATVTAMLTELRPDKPVTIGVPLPSYSIVILNPEHDDIQATGEVGEIGIAGIGVARGYLNNKDLTHRKFIPDFLGLANNTSKRIYRTGDLGRLNEEGEVEYLGRIDTQVKINGYRVELSEIEAVLMEFPEIAQAAVSTYEPDPGVTELVAYYVVKPGALPPAREAMAGRMRNRLPSYMVPAFLEELIGLPMSVSNKTDYKKLPPPKSPRLYFSDDYTAPENETQRTLCETLSKVLKFDRVSIDDDFFQDLGANSLLMARFSSELRSDPALAHVSLKDIYLAPTIRQLADQLEVSAREGVAKLKFEVEELRIPSNFNYWGCGVLQVGFAAAYGLLLMWLAMLAGTAIAALPVGSTAFFTASAALAVAFMVVPTAVAILAKWLLVGRWQTSQFPVWSPRYFRFWLVKTLVQTSPAAMFSGTPIYNIYLRLLGARIGRNAVLLSRSLPVCTDLFSVGNDTILRKDSVLTGYRVQSNIVHTGRVDIGDRSFVGEAAVLDIDTAIGDDAQLAYVSSLQSGQRIPDGKRFHGSPAVETNSDYQLIDPLPYSWLRGATYSAILLMGAFTLVWQIVVAAIYLLAHTGITGRLGVLDLTIVWALACISLGIFASGLALGLVWVVAIPRLCQLFLKPDRTYPLYGVHYWLQQIIFGWSNSRLFNLLFGDTSYIVSYLRWIGWDLGKVHQTGSNFGTNQRHDNPFLCRIGDGTMASDGLSMMNKLMSSTAFRLRPTVIGPNCFLGNDIHFPPDARAGANCLVGTKTFVPVDGPMRENVGLLGSPSFEIPRMVQRDRIMIDAFDDSLRQQRISKKNRHNIGTMALFLATRWLFSFLALFAVTAAISGYAYIGIFAPFLAALSTLFIAIGYYAFIERASLGFGRLKPDMFTIYDRYFWHHERHWKLSDSPIVGLFAGTPFRSIINRLLGVRVGSKVYDGGAGITERTLVEIGDNANLNEGCVLQSHSLEEGVFKSDMIRIGAGCSVGPSAFVHYGTTMEARSMLDADSFLMKGEIIAEGTGWRGNPARLQRCPR